jgi:endonuclease YncB( thermonuclease family)
MGAYWFALILGLVSSASVGSPISGVGKTIDGDSLKVGSTEVRLFGIDAPELAQACMSEGRSWPCGAEAARRLSNLVDGKLVTCDPVDIDKHGRTVARCKWGEVDINRSMVALGYALAYRQYSMDYVSAEESAKVSNRGIWSGTFELPSDVRHGDDDHVGESRKAVVEGPIVASRSKPQPSRDCRIKGNHSRRGEKIYHLPGMPYYTQTIAEQNFCSEDQARAAGYRRSRADLHR